MRPLELTLRDFRSYRGAETVFDFRGRRLVGIVGPIGSGKSSILDAISFALYGRTPIVAQNTKALIHQRADGATISLRFEVDGEIWEVVRALRKRGQSQHALYRYADDDDGDAIEKVTQERDVNARIQALLGLDFEAFGRSVLLAQGKFSEFLSSRPGERDKVLKGVFGHDRIDRMRELAKQRARDAASDQEKLSIKVEHLDRLLVEIAEHRVALDGLEARLEALQKAEPQARDLEAAITTADAEAKEAERALESLTTVGASLPDPAVVSKLVAEAGAASERRVRLGEALAAAREELQGAEDRLASADTEEAARQLDEATRLVADLASGTRALAEARVRQERAASREAEAVERRAASEARKLAAAGALDAAVQAQTRAETALQDAQRTLHEAQHADMAAALRAEISAGEPCPVCLQTVDSPPQASASIDLFPLEGALRTAEERRSAAAQEFAAAAAESRAADEALETAADGVGAAAAEHADAGDAVTRAEEGCRRLEERLTQILGEGEPETLLAGRRTELESLRRTATEFRKRVEKARRDHDDAIVAEQNAEKGLSELRLVAARLAPQLGIEDAAGDGDPAEVESSLVEARAAWKRQTEEATAGLASAREARRLRVAELATLLDGLGVEQTLQVAIAAAGAEARLHRDQIEAAESRVSEAEGLVAARDEAAAAAETYTRLASDLTDTRFIRFLLDEERARLAELGSDHFQRLSSGRYRFTSDGSFDIVDLTTADAVRKSDSLSGGETFLASLALALALAEMVTRTGGRLDSFFLDEGFGTLDPEHLDLAMEGIEALVAESADRLVVVVSHVPELRQRIEDLIQLDRNPTTGDTKVVRA